MRRWDRAARGLTWGFICGFLPPLATELQRRQELLPLQAAPSSLQNNFNLQFLQPLTVPFDSLLSSSISFLCELLV